MNKQEELIQVLQEKKFISSEQASNLISQAAAAKMELPNFILSNKLVSEEKLTEAKAEVYNLPYYLHGDDEVSEDVLNFLPEEIARTYHIVCFARENKVLKIGLVEPNLKAMEAVNFLALDEKLSVQYYLISNSSWDRIFKQYQKIEEEISSALEVKAQEEGDDIVSINTDENTLVDDKDINSAPVSRIVSVIIRHAVEAHASDIHIEPFDKESRVREVNFAQKCSRCCGF